MKSFKDFGIVATLKSFTGDKIRIEKIVNREVIVHDYKIEKSNFPEKGNGQRLVLQIKLNENMHVVFTSSVVLQDMIQKVPATEFPFTTTIEKTDGRFEFK